MCAIRRVIGVFHIWINCRADEEEVLRRIRVFALEDAEIWTPAQRFKCAVYWHTRFQELDELVKEHGPDLLGDKDFRNYKYMKDFANKIGDILATVTDVLQPKTYDEFIEYGLDIGE